MHQSPSSTEESPFLHWEMKDARALSEGECTWFEVGKEETGE